MNDPIALAQDAARAWGALANPARLIGARENAVFEILLRDGTRAALRIHRLGYQTKDAVEAELLWTEALAARGFPCPVPIRTTAGMLTDTLGNGQLVSLVSWLDGLAIGEAGEAFRGTSADQVEIYRKLGRLTRQMHDLTDDIDCSSFPRPRWDSDGLLGESPHWGRFWENPALSPKEVEDLQKARRIAAQQLLNINSLSFGLIHADLLQENVLQSGAGLHIIDFDDSGFGYRLYDLGTALVQHMGSPQLPALTDAICEGYGCAKTHIPLFIMLRAFASCGWVIARKAADDPLQRVYAERALHAARTTLG